MFLYVSCENSHAINIEAQECEASKIKALFEFVA